MKLTDENGGEWETIDGKDFKSFVIRKVEKPSNPMPELRPGYIIITDREEVEIVRLAQADRISTWMIFGQHGYAGSQVGYPQVKRIIGLDGETVWSREP